MRSSTAHIHIDESALRILAEEGYDTQQQASAFRASPETIRRRRRKWRIAGEGTKEARASWPEEDKAAVEGNT